MFNKKLSFVSSGTRFLVAIFIAIMSLSYYIPQTYAVYKYDNEEKDVYIWLVGIAEGEAGHLTLGGNIEPVIDNGLYEPGYFYNGRVALYLRGKIKGEYLINALYDTAKENPYNKLFSTIEPDKYYPVYGDSSSLKRVGESHIYVYSVRIHFSPMEVMRPALARQSLLPIAVRFRELKQTIKFKILA